MERLPKCIFKRWMHSREEDSETEWVFRPWDYDFPLSRAPREGYEFRKGGHVVFIRPGPADEPQEINGKFSVRENEVTLFFQDNRIISRKLELLSCDDNVMRLKRRKEEGVTAAR